MTDDLPPSALARRLLRLLNATKVIPWEADARTWQFTYVGPQAEALLGYPIETWEQMQDIAQNAFPVAFGNFRFLAAGAAGTNLYAN